STARPCFRNASPAVHSYKRASASSRVGIGDSFPSDSVALYRNGAQGGRRPEIWNLGFGFRPNVDPGPALTLTISQRERGLVEGASSAGVWHSRGKAHCSGGRVATELIHSDRSPEEAGLGGAALGVEDGEALGGGRVVGANLEPVVAGGQTRRQRQEIPVGNEL